jgi:hypothetical protein
MKKLLVLFALALGFTYFYPMRHEATATACAALDKRIAALLADQSNMPTAGMTQHLGDIAATYVHDRFPLFPQEAGCVVGYWGTTLKPDVARGAVTAYVRMPVGDRFPR